MPRSFPGTSSCCKVEALHCLPPPPRAASWPKKHVQRSSYVSTNENLTAMCHAAQENGFHLVTPPQPKTKRCHPSNEDGFNVPQKYARSATMVLVTPAPVPTQNSFNSLPVNTEEDGEDEIDPKPTRPRSQRPKPFYIEFVENHRQIMDDLFKPIGAQLTQKLTGKLVRITPIDIEQFRKVQLYLEEHKIKSVGMQLRSERPKKILIRGIPANIPLQEIKDAFAARVRSKCRELHNVS